MTDGNHFLKMEAKIISKYSEKRLFVFQKKKDYRKYGFK